MRFLKTSMYTLTLLPLALFSAGMALASEDAQRLEILGVKPSPTVAAEKAAPAAEPAPAAAEAAHPPATTAAEEKHEAENQPEAHEAAAPAGKMATAEEEHAAETQPEPHEATDPAGKMATANGHHADSMKMEKTPMGHAKDKMGKKMGHHEKKAAHHAAVHWGYEGAGAPHYWGDLKAEFATCKSGRSQSPIDISAAVITSLPAIEINYQDTVLNVVNNGHAIQVNYQAGSFINVGSKRFNLLQFHFHSPSEHTIGGKAYPMVAHLVHKADDGQLGVIGVMIKEGKASALLEQLWAHMPEEAGKTVTVEEESINVSDLLPRDLTYFNYSGSLTTPPCTEGVHWMVLAAPVEASAEQIARFRVLYPNNARPVQPVNGRIIRLGN